MPIRFPVTCVMNYRRKIFIIALLVWYASFSIAMAIAPADREFWMAASILPVLLVAGLVVTYRIFPLSSISYFLITLFPTLHAIGVHYTYAEVPFGSWLQQALAFERNHFDRIVHFCFGFLLTYPWEEWFRLFAHVRGWLRYYLPNITILGLSGLWEIVESWFAQLMNPDLGLVFLGSQGDVWDAQKDMSAALYGSLLCTLLIVLIQRRWIAPDPRLPPADRSLEHPL
jgi:putative membrane protein